MTQAIDKNKITETTDIMITTYAKHCWTKDGHKKCIKKTELGWKNIHKKPYIR